MSEGLDVLLDETEIGEVVSRLAGELSQAYDDGVVLVAVLRGSVSFLADLVREMTIRATVDFVAITPYTPETARVRLLMDVSTDLRGRQVVIIEDIVDTGHTASFLVGELGRRKPRSLSICTLVDRPVRRVVPVDLRYVGITVADQFVIGYGLDFAGRYRNLRVLAVADREILASDPDAYVETLYVA